MGAACLINSRDDLPCFEHSLDFGKLDCVCFFPLHGRREKNQEGMRIFIMLSHADPTVLMCTREKIQKKAFSCKERRFLVCVLRVQRERRGQEGGTRHSASAQLLSLTPDARMDLGRQHQWRDEGHH